MFNFGEVKLRKAKPADDEEVRQQANKLRLQEEMRIEQEGKIYMSYFL
jgi:hypothetical protein